MGSKEKVEKVVRVEGSLEQGFWYKYKRKIVKGRRLMGKDDCFRYCFFTFSFF